MRLCLRCHRKHLSSPEVIKTKFMLSFNSAEHEILNAYEYERSRNSGSDKPRVLFFLLINVRMPTTVGI